MFGYTLVKIEELERATSENKKFAAVQIENISLRDRIDDLNIELDSHKNSLPFGIDVNIGDPSPVDTEKRLMYVSQVAGLYRNILKQKIIQMISSAHSLLAGLENKRDHDLILKGAIYSFWELDRWGESMLNEQIANQIGDNPSNEGKNKINNK